MKPTFVYTICVVFVFCEVLLLYSSFSYTENSNFSNVQDYKYEINEEKSESGIKLNGKSNVTYNFVYSEKELRRVIENIHKTAVDKNRQDNAAEKCTKQLPKVLVLGVWKCGTREIADFISMNPDIVVKTDPYELNYFLKENPKDIGYSKYKEMMPCSNKDQLTMVKNPWYFKSGDIAARIQRFNTSLKMIVLIREPVARLLSSITFQSVNYPQKIIKNMTHSFMTEVFTQNGEISIDNKHVKYSRYVDGYKQYAKYFNMSQILFIDAMDFKQKPFVVLREVERFLGLKHFISESHFVYNPEKKFFCVRDPSSSTSTVTGFCFQGDRGRVNVSNTINITPETHQRLREYYKPYNEEFFDLIGRRLDW